MTPADFLQSNEFILLLLLGSFVSATSCQGFPQDYRPCGLKNGCLPEAYGFYDTFKRQYPDESAELMLLELPDDDAELYGHAVVVFSWKNHLCLWDHEAGTVEVDESARTDKSALRAAVVRSYLATVKRLKNGTRFVAPRAVTSGEKACTVVARLLAGRHATLIEFLTHDCRRLRGVAFVGGGMLWLYCPEQGAAFAPVQPDSTYASLVKAALDSSYPRAKIIPSFPTPPPPAYIANLPSTRQ
jgi:hypothetical protein